MHFISTLKRSGSETLWKLPRYPALDRCWSRVALARTRDILSNGKTWRWRTRLPIYRPAVLEPIGWLGNGERMRPGGALSLDTGPASIEQNQSVEIRCSLRNLDGSMAEGKSVIAVVRSGGQVKSRIPMAGSDERPGYYAALAGAWLLAITRCKSNSWLSTRSPRCRFQIHSSGNSELRNARLAQNVGRLEQLPERTGGIYVPEERSAN